MVAGLGNGPFGMCTGYGGVGLKAISMIKSEKFEEMSSNISYFDFPLHIFSKNVMKNINFLINFIKQGYHTTF